MLPRKTSLTLGMFVLGAALLRFIPAAKPTVSVAAPAIPAIKGPDFIIPAGSLDAFFAALRRTEAKEPGAVTRILHYGDSPTTADSITSDIRRLLQARFGDAGHGFVLAAKPWAWYSHNGIELVTRGWRAEPANEYGEADGIHGLGGASFTGGYRAISRVTLPDSLSTRAVVYYLAQPGGGDFTVTAGDTKTGDTKLGEVHTEADASALAFAAFRLPPQSASLQLAVLKGPVRMFGFRFDKDQPGVQYSSLGVNGAQVQMIVRRFEPAQWAAALRHEDPALVVLNYGTNESLYPAYVRTYYPEELRKVIARIRAALPRASILLMGPMDRGAMAAGGAIATPASLPALIEIQKRIAVENGCAFFNTFQAMGGAGTMARWYNAQPRLVSADFIHPLPRGAAIVGELFEKALVASYAASQ